MDAYVCVECGFCNRIPELAKLGYCPQCTCVTATPVQDGLQLMLPSPSDRPTAPAAAAAA